MNVCYQNTFTWFDCW